MELESRIDTVKWEVSVDAGFRLASVGHRQGVVNAPRFRRGSQTDYFGGLDLPGGMRCYAKSSRGQVAIGFEGSLPRAMTGHNVYALPLGEAAEVMREVESNVSEHLRLPPFRLETRILRRLDVVRDFTDVRSPTSLIEAIGRDTSYRRTGSDRYSAGRGGTGGTIYRGPQDARSVLYEKATAIRRRCRHLSPQDREALARESEGRVRYELRLAGEALWAVGQSIADLDPETLTNVMRSRFQQAQFASAVVSVPRLVDVLIESGMSAAERNSFIGYMVQEASGCQSDLSHNTADKYRRRQRQLGLSAVDLRLEGTPTRLDFETGRAVEV